MDSVITCLINDDPVSLSEEAPSGFFLLPPPNTLPEFLRNHPTLIALSAYYGAKRCFTYLLQSGENEQNCDVVGHDAIHFACANNQYIMCQYLCEVFNQQYNQDNSLKTPLHIAASFGAKECVEILIKNHADVKSKDAEGISPLHYAYNSDIASILINNGASINARSNDGATPLMYAAKRGELALCSFLIENGAKTSIKSRLGWTPYHYAAQSGNLRTIRRLYKEIPEHIADLDNEGRTCLHYAAEDGDSQVIVFLLKHGCDPNVADHQGMTPLHFAASEGNVVACRAIIGCGGDVNAKDSIGRNSLHFASMSGNLTTIQFFSDKLSVESTTVHGTTPIHFAAAFDKSEAVEMLSQSGVDTINNYGKTPLAIAAEHHSSNAIRTLLKKGASVNIQDKSHMNPIDHALFSNSEEAVELLADAGAIPSPMWSRRSSARNSACCSQSVTPMSSPQIFMRFSQQYPLIA